MRGKWVVFAGALALVGAGSLGVAAGASGSGTRMVASPPAQGNSQAAKPAAVEETWVVASVQGDVTGDGVADTVRLVALGRLAGGGFAREHDLELVDGRSGKVVRVALGPESGGYAGSLFLGDFTGDKVKDVLVGVPTGWSGGIVHYYLLSAVGGQLALLSGPEGMLPGPSLKATFLDGFKVRVEGPEMAAAVTLDLVKWDGAVMAEVYRGVYDASGRLLKPADGVIDPYGAVEPRDLDGDGVIDLVGYQALWGVYHANTIGTVRSVWRWKDGALRLVEVTVGALYSPEDYAQELGRIDPKGFAVAVRQAVRLYRDRVAGVPPAWRDEAFLRFREFHQRVEESTEKAWQGKLRDIYLTPAGGAGDPYATVRRLVDQVNASEAYRAAGLYAVHAGEGEWVVTTRPGFYAETFGTWLSPGIREFLALEDVERSRPFAMDAGIVIPEEELERRLGAWEAYRTKYPRSPFAENAKRYYVSQLNAFLFGLENTPHFDWTTKKVRPGVVENLRRYAAGQAGTLSGGLAARVVALYGKYQCTLTSGLRADLERLRAEAGK